MKGASQPERLNKLLEDVDSKSHPDILHKFFSYAAVANVLEMKLNVLHSKRATVVFMFALKDFRETIKGELRRNLMIAENILGDK